MKKMLAVGAVALAGVALCVTSAMAAGDKFNRSDLGKRWVVPDGSLFITSDQLQGDPLSLGYDKRSSADTTVKAKIFTNGTDLEYGAVASGDIAGGNNAFVKIQAQSADGMFDTAAFYTGNNGGGDFFTLDSEVPSPATLTVSFCGTVATMKIKSSAGVQKYTDDYGTSFGTGGGLGTYGLISLDNYRSKTGGCAASVGESAKGARVIAHSTAKDLSLAK